MNWGDVDCDQLTLVLRAENTKSRKRRVLPLRGTMVEVLQDLRKVHEAALARVASDTDPVFRTPEAATWPRATNNAMRIFNRVLVRAAITRLDPEGCRVDIHSLRHTFGSRLARNGVGLVHVQRLMGHSDPKLTAQVYTHLGVEDLRSAVAALEST